MKDSDCDGLTNGYELGDPDCTWEPGKTPARTTRITHPGFASVELGTGALLDSCTNYTRNFNKYSDLGLNISYLPLIYEQGIQVPAKITSYYNWVFQLNSINETMMAFRVQYIKGKLLHHMILHTCGPEL